MSFTEEFYLEKIKKLLPTISDEFLLVIYELMQKEFVRRNLLPPVKES